MSKQRLRVLVVGCGAAAQTHSAILRRSGVELYFASRDMRRAVAYNQKFGGRQAFGSYAEALTHDVDAVLVTTPTSSHRTLALQALDAGKHVIVEKPAFMSTHEADELGRRAERFSLQVLVAENYYYKPIAEYLRALIGSGGLGDVRFVTINATKAQRSVGWRANPAIAGGGPMFEGGVHWISFASNIGLEVETASGYPTADARSSLVVLRYANGAVGTLAHSWELGAPLGLLRLSKVQGTRGAVTFESNGVVAVTTGASRSIHFPALFDPTGTRGMWVDFLRVLRSGGEPRFTLPMARRDLRVLASISEQPCLIEVRGPVPGERHMLYEVCNCASYPGQPARITQG